MASLGFIKLPSMDGLDDATERKRIKDYLFMLNEQLRYTLYNLDDDNIGGDGISEKSFSKGFTERFESAEGSVLTISSDIEHLSIEMSNQAGDISTLQQTAASHLLRIQNAEGDLSLVTQTAQQHQVLLQSLGDDMTLVQTSLTLKADGAELISVKDNLQAQINAVPGQITLAVQNIQPGVRNLIPESYFDITSGAYGFGPRDLTVRLKPNTTYTLTMCGHKGNSSGELRCYVYTQTWVLSHSLSIAESAETVKQITFATATNASDYPWKFALYNYPNGSSGEVYCKWATLVEGNKAPIDWVPASEDAQSKITQLSIDLDAAEAAITLKAETSVTDGLNTRMNSAELKLTQEYITTWVRNHSAYKADLAAKSKVTALNTAPSGAIANDLWIDTASGNILKRWTGSAWAIAQDDAISQAQQTANKFSWLIASGTSGSDMTLTDKLYELVTNKVMITANEQITLAVGGVKPASRNYFVNSRFDSADWSQASGTLFRSESGFTLRAGRTYYVTLFARKTGTVEYRLWGTRDGDVWGWSQGLASGNYAGDELKTTKITPAVDVLNPRIEKQGNGTDWFITNWAILEETTNPSTGWYPALRDPWHSVVTQGSYITLLGDLLRLQSGGKIELLAGALLKLAAAVVQIDATDGPGSYINFGSVFNVGVGADGAFGMIINGAEDAIKVNSKPVLHRGNVVTQQAQPPGGKGIIWLKPITTAQVQYSYTIQSKSESTYAANASKTYSLAAASSDVMSAAGTYSFSLKFTLRHYGDGNMSLSGIAVQLTKGSATLNLSHGAVSIGGWANRDITITGTTTSTAFTSGTGAISCKITPSGTPVYQATNFLAHVIGSVIELTITGPGGGGSAQLCEVRYVP